MSSDVLDRAMQAVAPAVRAELDKPEVLRWLNALTPIYQQQGVLQSDFAPALHQACQEREACWRRLPAAAAPDGTNIAGPSADGSIYWPWVGEHYAAGGLCVVGINLNHGKDYWS